MIHKRMIHKRIRKFVLGILAFPAFLAFLAFLLPAVGSVGADLGGVRSPRTGVIDAFISHWPPAGLSRELAREDQPVRVRAWTTAGNDLYMGLEQSMIIDAKLEVVEAILDDFGHYQDLFPDYKDIHVVSRQGSRVLVFWEQRVPIFFLPDIRYEMIYDLDKSLPDRRIYRYQLWKQGQLRHSDGLIVLERHEESHEERHESGGKGSGAAGGLEGGKGPHQANSTFYFELDFFDADWGPARIFGKDRLWKETVDGLFLSDVAVKLKAEHPEWSYAKIRGESARELDRKEVRSRIDSCIRRRALFPAGLK